MGVKRDCGLRGGVGGVTICGRASGLPAKPRPGCRKKTKQNPGLSCRSSSNRVAASATVRTSRLWTVAAMTSSPFKKRVEHVSATRFLFFFGCFISLCTYTLLLLLPGTIVSCRCCCCCLIRLKRLRKAGSLSLVLLERPETL